MSQSPLASLLGGAVLAGCVVLLLTPESHPKAGHRAGHPTCTARMPLERSSAIKRQMAIEQAVDPRTVELDHIVPLCMCGSNDKSNLQLQPWEEARRKDAVEARLCKAVSEGSMSLPEAQRTIKAWRP